MDKETKAVIIHPKKYEDGKNYLLEEIPDNRKEEFIVLVCDGTLQDIQKNYTEIKKINPKFVLFTEEMDYDEKPIYEYAERLLVDRNKRNSAIPILSHFSSYKKHGAGKEYISDWVDSYYRYPSECIREYLNYFKF